MWQRVAPILLSLGFRAGSLWGLPPRATRPATRGIRASFASRRQ